MTCFNLRIFSAYQCIICAIVFCCHSLAIYAQQKGRPELHRLHINEGMEERASVQELLSLGGKAESIALDSALSWYKKAYIVALRKGNPDSVFITLYYTSGAHMRQGHIEPALNDCNKALAIYSKHQLSNVLQPYIYGNMGTLYFFRADYKLAAAYFDSALQANSALKGTDDFRANTMINQGVLYLRLQQPTTALRYLEQGEIICRSKGYTRLLSLLLHNKGGAYLSLQDEKKAKECYIEQLDIATSINDPTGIITAHSGMGDLLLRQHKPEEALVHLQKAAHLLQADNPYQTFVYIHKNLAKAYFQLKNYAKAEQQLVYLLKYTKQTEVTDELPEVHKTLVALYEATGRYDKALDHQKQLMLLNDSLFSRDKIKEINELDTRYRTAEKDKEILLQKSILEEKEHKLREKNFWIVGIMLAVFLLTVIFILFILVFRNRQKMQAKKIQLLQQEKEMNHLKDMMVGEEQERKRLARELHDGIGGMLAAVNMNLSTIDKHHRKQYRLNDLEPVMQMVEATADEVRKTAHNLMPDVLTRYSLPEALKQYCDQVTKSGQLHISLSIIGVQNTIPKPLELILYRIVQELIQNIIKHAHAQEAVVEIAQRDDKVLLIIEDNGVGFDTSTHEGGYGLQNLRHRIQSMKGNISIESAPGRGTTIHISFDLEAIKNIWEYEH